MGIKGSILGDIIGSKWEFNWHKNACQTQLLTCQNFFTDDTILNCATKYAIIHKISFEDAYRIFVNRYRSYPYAGWGCNFANWINHSPAFRQSIGNGAAMRVGYIAEYTDSLSYGEKLAKDTAETTHGTNDGVTGATATVVCAIMAKHGHSKEDLKMLIDSYYPEHEDKDLAWYRKNYKWSELCRDSVHLAVTCVAEANSFEECMRNVLSVHCDTDTIGAIAGGIAEEMFGLDGLDEYLGLYLDDFLMEVVDS